jgi:hypothetical protein
MKYGTTKMIQSNQFNMNQFKNTEEHLAFLAESLRFMDGAMNSDEIAAFNEELAKSSLKLASFADLQVQGAMVRNSIRQSAYELNDDTPIDQDSVLRQHVRSSERNGWQFYSQAALAIVASGLLVVASYWVGRWGTFALPSVDSVVGSNRDSSPLVLDASSESKGNLVNRNVILKSSAGAKFFGELIPSNKNSLMLKRDYVLTDGMVEVLFPDGAQAIIESPAIFRVIDEACLAMDSGNCSVYAPDGAEGFRVETPTSRIVDRGTRFIVSVGENAATEVRVVEGAADVYDLDSDDTGVHLVDYDAKRFLSGRTAVALDIPFSPNRYQVNLPDRLVGYEASESTSGSVEELLSVTVQRDGVLSTFDVYELIGVSISHFKGGANLDTNGHLACEKELPRNVLSLLSDNKLNTGIINPGGSSSPPTQSPQSNTLGMAVQFNKPVINGPGPDVVFFELQSLTNPIDGDAFHVCPIQFTEKSKSHTIRSYDLTLASPETKIIKGFFLHRFQKPIESIEDLVASPAQGSPIRLAFRAVAVGIDLSDLGYESNEQASGLFIQDAADNDKDIVDPVFIAGLPTDEQVKKVEN